MTKASDAPVPVTPANGGRVAVAEAAYAASHSPSAVKVVSKLTCDVRQCRQHAGSLAAGFGVTVVSRADIA